jgi:hypothetical protein
MTQANEPNDFTREINRRFRDLSWRVERLESTQMPARSIDAGFDRVYDEIDALRDEMRERFNTLDAKFNALDAKFNTLDAKFEIVMKYITGQ